MNIFVTGASGFIGSAVVQELLGQGHQVTGLARSDASAAALEHVGVRVHRGTIDDPAGIAAAAAEADGVVHLAFKHDDFTDMVNSAGSDLLVVKALTAALAGTDRPLVVTSATALVAGLGRPAIEDDEADPDRPGAARGPAERTTVAVAEHGVRSSLVRLPPSVHGAGDGHGFVPTLVRIAREKGQSAYVGDGSNVWPAVHRLDAAHLFRLALESAPAGTRLHAAAEQGVPMRDIATAIGDALGVPVVSLDPADAAAQLGWIAGFAAADNPTSSARTRELLGWEPTGPTLLDDLAAGVYGGV
ncbi:SDR family oxidoreductase [Nocardioides sp.]|uniref:SDR family oxidoreductase n=1 Tax=Nocardioides sp. TaxID=35761 RepID=UPI00271F93DB|nr:SDR family oxidoreductase [Nocardioides sp.]MDO9455627.1 SDR family oxidoreductase [Nocardioides sp.]